MSAIDSRTHAAVGHGGDGDLGPQRTPVGVLEAARAAEARAAAAQHLAVRVPGPPVGREVDEIGGGLLPERLRLGAEEGAEGVVGRDDDAVLVDHGHRELGDPEGGAVVAEFGGEAVGAPVGAVGPVLDGVIGVTLGVLLGVLRGVTLRECGLCRVRLRRLWVHRSFGGSAHRSLP